MNNEIDKLRLLLLLEKLKFIKSSVYVADDDYYIYNNNDYYQIYNINSNIFNYRFAKNGLIHHSISVTIECLKSDFKHLLRKKEIEKLLYENTIT